MPKTFKIPVDDAYRDKKHKKSKKSKSREKEKEPSSKLPIKSAPEVSSHDTGEGFQITMRNLQK